MNRHVMVIGGGSGSTHDEQHEQLLHAAAAPGSETAFSAPPPGTCRWLACHVPNVELCRVKRGKDGEFVGIGLFKYLA
jgi:hypothetical protein